jgi:hypothetical protein
MREFGHGENILGQSARLSGLCGHCWNGRLCIAPDGAAYPCVMARKWPVGDVLRTSLADIVRDARLEDVRKTIFDTVWLPKVTSKRANSSAGGKPEPPSPSPDCTPGCAPDQCLQTCSPELHTCGPVSCPQSCDPNHIQDYPTESPPAEPVEDCPQTCSPDLST